MEWSPVLRVLAALEAIKVDYVVVGGVAVNLHGIARATEDLDIFVAPDAAKLKAAFELDAEEDR